jgi:hypothetical protein
MADRGGIRLIFFDPEYDSVDIRSRFRKVTCGTRPAMAPRMVSDPRNSVSCSPRARSSRSVKTCPRSASAQSWISSTATKSAPISSGIASVVQTQYCVRSGTIRSSPVTSATTEGPTRATIRS